LKGIFMKEPLILVTNDDGIQSAGLWAVVEALLPLGELLVVAPDRQWSGGGRSMPPDVTGRMTDAGRYVNGRWVRAYAVDASPALCVVHGVLELADRRPDLVVSGVNFGSNMGTEVTVSGTVGAALEGGAFGIAAMAISLDMDKAYHLKGDVHTDYEATKAYTYRFASYLLGNPLSPDVDAININLPAAATAATPWRMTRSSRHRFYEPLAPDRTNAGGRPGYRRVEDFSHTEKDSDIYCVKVAGDVAVTPLSLDLTSRVDLQHFSQSVRASGVTEPSWGQHQFVGAIPVGEAVAA
jgi:5'-nucleotidase